MTVIRSYYCSHLATCNRNQNALGGPVSADLFQDAAALEDTSAQQEDPWREWPLLATDGDCAGLIQLVSENKVLRLGPLLSCHKAGAWL